MDVSGTRREKMDSEGSFSGTSRIPNAYLPTGALRFARADQTPLPGFEQE